MMTRMRRDMRARGAGACAAALLAIVAWTSAAQAIERKPLPPFQLRALDGGAVASDQLHTGQSQWLILYVTSECAACDRLIAALPAWQPNVLANTVIVVGGNADAARAYAQSRARQEPSLRVFVDADARVPQALAIAGAPVLVGVRAGQIEWSIAGVLNDPSALEPIVKNWLHE
jgi:hypothetical protein